MTKKTKKSTDSVSQLLSQERIDHFNFELWAGAVRQQMLAALRRRGVE